MYDDVLVPTDGSRGTAETLDHALAIARDNDATVHAVYVVDQRQYRAAEADAKAEVIRSLETEGERAIDDVRVRVEEAGLPLETELAEGIPTREIAAYVESADIDLAVMGTHGHTGRNRVANLGSVTERVIKNVDVPVLVVDIGD